MNMVGLYAGEPIFGGGAYIWKFMVANKFDKLFIEAFKKYV